MSTPINIPNYTRQDKTNRDQYSQSCPNYVFYDESYVKNHYKDINGDSTIFGLGLSWKMHYKLSPQNLIIGNMANSNKDIKDIYLDEIQKSNSEFSTSTSQSMITKRVQSLGSLDYSSSTSDHEHEHEHDIIEGEKDIYDNHIFDCEDDNIYEEEPCPFTMQTFMDVAAQLLREDNE
jgi:hypothetical protein